MSADRRHGFPSHGFPSHEFHRVVRQLVRRGWGLLVALALVLTSPLPALAGPVDWEEVPATAEGRQWWDRGSLRLDRQQRLTVLSRYLPPAVDGDRPPSGSLYVMELDCGQALYRDLQRNGLPRLQASWEAAAGDALVGSVLEASCAEARRQGLLG